MSKIVSMTAAEATVESLIAHGIDTLYALPGLHNDPLFDALHGAQDRLRVIHPRHEQACGYMAMGAAMATGKIQACAVVPGPGFLNMTAALLTARGTNAPVLALIGQIPQSDIDRGHGHLHELHDQLGIARHIAKYTARITSAVQAPDIIAEAIKQALSGRPGPVVVECAIDIWGRKGAVDLDMPVRAPTRPAVDLEAIARAADLLKTARKPLIVLGGGAQDAATEITALAEFLEAPAVGFRRGQGVVSGHHRLSVNFPVAHRLWAEADVVIGIGTRLHMPQAMWGTDDALKIIRIDIDAEEIDRLKKPAVAILADAREGVATLLNTLQKTDRPHPSREEELAPHRLWAAEKLEKLEPQISFIKAMRAALPEDGILVDEVTQLGFASRLGFPVLKPRSFLSPGYQDNLGWGYGTALGVKVAVGERPVLAISGDGGFMYQASELATAMHHRIALVVVVFDNGLFGNVRLIQQQAYGNRVIASDLTNPDFVKFAESFGMATFRARNGPELEEAIRKAFALKAPALIHVPCGPMPSPWDMILMPKVRG